MASETYIGLDLETSGVDIDAGSVPIQIGVSLGAALNAVMDIGWPSFDTVPGGRTWNIQSEAVHGISKNHVIDAFTNGYPVERTDRTIFDWLQTFAHVGPHDAVLVGWNVGTFDFPFVRRYMPLTASLCSYRFVDLNAVCFTMANAGRRRAYKPDQAIGAKGWKARAKKVAETMMGGEPNWHDAGYDATASLLEWFWLTDHMETRES